MPSLVSPFRRDAAHFRKATPMNLKRSATAALALASLLGLAACGGAAPSTEASGSGSDAEGITVYNAQHETMTQAWIDAFTHSSFFKILSGK